MEITINHIFNILVRVMVNLQTNNNGPLPNTGPRQESLRILQMDGVHQWQY